MSDLLAAVRAFCRALDAERVAIAAAEAHGDPEYGIGARVDLMRAELELRRAATEEDQQRRRRHPPKA